MKKLTIEGEALKEDFQVNYSDIGCTCFSMPPCSHCTHPGHPESLANSPMLWNSVSTLKMANKWYATYDLAKPTATVFIGKGDTEQEAVDNLRPELLL